MARNCKRCGAFVSAGEPGSIEALLDESIDSAPWIADADQATVAVLRSLAARLDAMRAESLFGPAAGKPAYDAQVMLGYLSALMLTPGSRESEPGEDEDGGDLIGTLRAISTGE